MKRSWGLASLIIDGQKRLMFPSPGERRARSRPPSVSPARGARRFQRHDCVNGVNGRTKRQAPTNLRLICPRGRGGTGAAPQRDLTAAGCDVWLDTQRIGGGASWTLEIEQAIDQAHV